MRGQIKSWLSWVLKSNLLSNYISQTKASMCSNKMYMNLFVEAIKHLITAFKHLIFNWDHYTV